MDGNSRIQDGDDYQEAMWKMSGGNPGATVAMVEMAKVAHKDGCDPLSPLRKLDKAGLYESDVWLLYRDVCDKDAKRSLKILEDFEAGIIPKEQLLKAVRNRGEGLADNPAGLALKKPTYGDDGYGGGGRGTGLTP